MADVVWSPLYGQPGTGSGFEDGAAGLTPITGAALDNLVTGIQAGIADRIPTYLEGLPLTGGGDSYAAYTGNSYVHWFDKIKARMRLQSGQWYNAGVGGFLAADAAAFAFGTFHQTCQGGTATAANGSSAGGTVGPAAGGFAILHVGRNDAGFDGRVGTGGTTAKAQAGFVNGVDSWIRVNRAASRVENTAATFSAGWTHTTGQTACSGGTVSSTTTPGATATYSLTLTTATTASLVVLGLDDDEFGVVGAPYSVVVDGSGSTITGTTSQQMKRTYKSLPDARFVHKCIPLGTLAAGTHTAVLTHTGTSGQALYTDCALIAQSKPPTVILIKLPQITQTGLDLSYPGYGASWAKDQTYLGLYDTVAARFPADGSIVVVDPNQLGWDPTTMIGNSDGFQIHANDLGNSFYADMLTGVLRSLTPRDGMIRTT